MPSPRASLRTRRGWRESHFRHLRGGVDWFHSAWGALEQLPDPVLIAAVADMAACYAAHAAEIHEGHDDVWFARYADNPQTLIDEVLADDYRPHALAALDYSVCPYRSGIERVVKMLGIDYRLPAPTKTSAADSSPPASGDAEPAADSPLGD